MKKFFNFLLIICIIVLLVGCGAEKNTNNQNKKIDYLNNPKSKDVAKAIESIDGISNVCIVTEDNDPNGQLGKQGGYTGALYYVYDKAPTMETTLDKDTFEERPYKDTCEKGTDAGGSIEIYKTIKEAKTREKYLATFDSTGALASGSHTVKGTLVIRTSNKLKASEQKDLEEKIVKKLS